MSGEDRRNKLLALLRESVDAISGEKLAQTLGVSRQVIVQDVALLRAAGNNILSTSRGYLLMQSTSCRRVFKVRHSDGRALEELYRIVDLGGRVEDVFVYHKIYGVIRAPMDIRSRRDAQQLMEQMRAGTSTQLMHITSGYHYHTVAADTKETLDLIGEALRQDGFLAPLRDYEPVDFGEAER